jgi:HK97 family phage prohead protease
MPIERRHIAGGEVRADVAGRRLEGYAARFGVAADIGGNFVETIRAGAFRSSLAAGNDVAALVDHSEQHLLGRTRSGTLTLAEDASGLRFSVRLPDTQAGRDVLEEGMKFEAAQMSLEDAELKATREFQAVEICRLLQVPPACVGILHDSNFSSAQAASAFFAVNCLTPWVTAIEQEFSRSVFMSPRFGLELDLSGLLRGTYSERAQTGIALLRAGAITANELRHELSLDPRPDGDKLIMQSIGGRPPDTQDGQGDTLP